MDLTSSNRSWPTLPVVVRTAVAAMALVVFTFHASAVGGQSQASVSGNTTFDVASVKRNTSGSARGFGPVIPPGGRYTISNTVLRQIVRSAYAEGQSSLLASFRIVGGPGWLDSDRFDVVAEAHSATPTRAEYRVMLQSLLRDRFKLAVHWETRSLPTYALVSADGDGRLGPTLHLSTVDCAAIFGGAAEPARKPGDLPPCGTIQSSPGHITARGRSLDMLAGDLSETVGRVVDNRTTLTGYFDADIEWQSTDAPADSSGPSIFTALQEQLGLKLESTRGPVSVLVIDRVEAPTPD